MKKVRVSIATTHGREEITGALVAPGLAVVPFMVVVPRMMKNALRPANIRARPGLWSITHIPTGRSIGRPKSWKQATEAAKRLAAIENPLGNWDRPGESLSDLGFGMVAVLAALGEVRIESHQEDDGDA